MNTDLSDALWRAVQSGEIDKCRDLLARGAKADHRQSQALASAAWNGHIEICQLLLDHGAKADDERSHSLAEAARTGHIDICRLLIDHGAKADCPWGLRLAAARGHIDICRLLLDSGASFAGMGIRERSEVFRKLPAGDLDIAKALYPEWGTRWLIAKARKSNPGLADALEAGEARKSVQSRLRGRMKMRP